MEVSSVPGQPGHMSGSRGFLKKIHFCEGNNDPKEVLKKECLIEALHVNRVLAFSWEANCQQNQATERMRFFCL